MVERKDMPEEFRRRLSEAMDEMGLNRSQLARRVGIDRSTLSQIMGSQGGRLPRADTAAAMAAELQVSLDWLMGLSQQRPGVQGAEIVEQSLEIEPGDPASAEQLLSRWHLESRGFKIRYVPSSLPDQMKTAEVIDFEHANSALNRPEDVRERSARQLAYARGPETDVEVCSSIQSLEAFVAGEGIWKNLDRSVRLAQLDRMVALVDELYPTFRWFLFDGRAHFAPPVTIFGPRRAAVYMGDMYFVFNTTGHIQALVDRFDWLIRAAIVQPTDILALFQQWRSEV
ncbi:MAG: helix-turn-helix transcriptional regulator [Alphaproteobacteria bacterium]|nr:helix-turn-helix transcriptional regulator [Alphaproteobacteria bacterium]